MEANWTIIADDLTGAGDAGAGFAARGYSTCIWLHGHAPAIPFNFDIPVFETSSRHLDAGEAYARVRAALAFAPGRRIFKKLDSTLKGNILAELEAVRDAAPGVRIILAPAHPMMGRTIRKGVLFVHGEDSGQRAPEAEWLECLDELPETIEDDAIYAGSGALAQKIAATLPRKPDSCFRPRHRRVAVIAGSRNPTTLAQVEMLRAQNLDGVSIFEIERDRLDSADFKSFLSFMPRSALLIAGGDTARAIAAHLGADGIRLAGEEIPGIPWGVWIGGDFDGLPIATKSGGFGQIDVLAGAVRLLRGESI
ncbi:MAG: hypothetical protein IT167_01320 [Bryobacterales bacterium]|nr:hypothetical protein [Bryobacterales bacterium]